MKVEVVHAVTAALRMGSVVGALALLSACGPPQNSAGNNESVNAAAIAKDAAQMSADDMHNQMSGSGRGGQPMNSQTMDHHQMGMNQMGMGQMQGGTNMSGMPNQPMPADSSQPMPMPMKEDDM